MMFLLAWCCAPTKSSNNIRFSAVHRVRFRQILLQKSFCTRDQTFLWLYRMHNTPNDMLGCDPRSED